MKSLSWVLTLPVLLLTNVRASTDLLMEDFEEPVSEEAVLKRRIGRIRDVAVAPDGAVLLLSDEHDGGLYRITR